MLDCIKSPFISNPFAFQSVPNIYKVYRRVLYWPQSYRVTDAQGYSVYRWVKFFVPDFKKLLYSLRSQRDKCFHNLAWTTNYIKLVLFQISCNKNLWCIYDRGCPSYPPYHCIHPTSKPCLLTNSDANAFN